MSCTLFVNPSGSAYARAFLSSSRLGMTPMILWLCRTVTFTESSLKKLEQSFLAHLRQILVLA